MCEVFHSHQKQPMDKGLLCTTGNCEIVSWSHLLKLLLLGRMGKGHEMTRLWPHYLRLVLIGILKFCSSSAGISYLADDVHVTISNFSFF